MMLRATLLSAALCSTIFMLTVAWPCPAAAHLDVAFLIDTTGSMSGEIREAKDRVRQISDALVAVRPGERIRIGVVAFRDRGDAYVTQLSPLSANVDDSSRFLATLRADGGGDGPEDVISGLRVAIHDLDWDRDPAVERQVFLIGDAPPHLDYRDNPDPEMLFSEARRRRVVINTIGCRSLPARGIAFFRRVAYATEGSYQHIGRVRTQEEGLAQAMLRALAPAADAKDGGEPIGVRLIGSDDAVLSGGLLVLHGDPLGRDGADCRITVLMPEGVGLRHAPRVAQRADGLTVELSITQGRGGSKSYALDRCVPKSTPIRVSFGG